jgi:hypothetical protein
VRAPRLATLAARYAGHGRGYAYGLVDGGCSRVNVRFTVAGPGGRTVATTVQRVSGRYGPQVVCAALKGRRAGGRYAIRIVTSPASRARGAPRPLRASGPPRTVRRQEGCA